MNIPKPIFICFLYATICINLFAQSGKLDSLKSAFKKEVNDSLKVNLLLSIAVASENQGPENEESYTKQALGLAKEINYYKGIAIAYDRLGVIERNRSNYSQSLNFHNWALENITPYGICREKAVILNNIGVVYRRLDELSKATDYHLRALKIAEEINDQKSVSVSTNSLGNIFLTQGNYQEALNYFQKALQQERESKNMLGVAINLNNIGAVFNQQHVYNKAIDYYTQSLNVNKLIGNRKGISICLNSLGETYLMKKTYQKAIEMYENALDINIQLGDRIYTSESYINLGGVFTIIGKYAEAEENIKKGLEIALNIGSKFLIETAYLKYSELFEKKGNYKKSLEMFKLSKELSDSIFNDSKITTIARLKTIYETEKSEKEIQSQRLQLTIKNKQILKEKALKVIFIGGFAVMILVSLLLYRNYILKKKANVVLTNYNRDISEKNGILMMQKEEIMSQRDQIEEKNRVVNKAYDLIKNKNKNIIENIRYAFQIQNALLPPVKKINEYFPKSFIMYKPRDIVSGDFYWATYKNNRLIVTTADCTGHGVSGAFMSILGISALNEIVNEKGIVRTDQILNSLRERIIFSMQQEDKFWEAKDGIDMTIFSFDFAKRKVMFSGANTSAMLIRNDEVSMLKGDKMPVSIFLDIIPFSTTEIDIHPNDAFYLYSDGYHHQFGGLYGKKFSIRQFNNLLLKIHHLEPEDQLAKLEETFRKWRSRNEQVDDILIMGLTITEEMLNGI